MWGASNSMAFDVLLVRIMYVLPSMHKVLQCNIKKDRAHNLKSNTGGGKDNWKNKPSMQVGMKWLNNNFTERADFEKGFEGLS